MDAGDFLHEIDVALEIGAEGRDVPGAIGELGEAEAGEDFLGVC